jgi:hypothetical protein
LQDSSGENPIHIPWTSDGDAPDATSVSEVLFTNHLLALLLIFGEALSFGVAMSCCTWMLGFLERMDMVKSRLLWFGVWHSCLQR